MQDTCKDGACPHFQVLYGGARDEQSIQAFIARPLLSCDRLKNTRWEHLPRYWIGDNDNCQFAVLCHLLTETIGPTRALVPLINAGFHLNDCDVKADYFGILVCATVRVQDKLLMELIIDAITEKDRSGEENEGCYIYYNNEESVYLPDERCWVTGDAAVVATMKFMWWCWQQFYQRGSRDIPVDLNSWRWSCGQTFWDSSHFYLIRDAGVPLPLLMLSTRLHSISEWFYDQPYSFQNYLRIELQQSLSLRDTLQDMTKLQSVRDSQNTTTLFDVGPLLDLITAYTVPTNELITRAAEQALSEWDEFIEYLEEVAQQRASQHEKPEQGAAKRRKKT